MRLLIIGPPGAGKGTQARLVAERIGIPAISTGDIFRAMKTADTALARQVQAIMASGGYVDDEITNQIVAERLAQPDCADGFLLDGYPRTVGQVANLDEVLARTGTDLDAVISLMVDTDEVVDRLLDRALAEGREDDTADTIRVRLQIYHHQTAPLVELYAGRGLVIEVDGLGSVSHVLDRIVSCLRQERPSRLSVRP